MQSGQVAGMFWRQFVPPELVEALVLDDVVLVVLDDVVLVVLDDVVVVLDDVVLVVLDDVVLDAVVVVVEAVVLVVALVLDAGLLTDEPPPSPEAEPDAGDPPVCARTGSSPSAHCVSNTRNAPATVRLARRLRRMCSGTDGTCMLRDRRLAPQGVNEKRVGPRAWRLPICVMRVMRVRFVASFASHRSDDKP
jgi:hypothetical protein